MFFRKPWRTPSPRRRDETPRLATPAVRDAGCFGEAVNGVRGGPGSPGLGFMRHGLGSLRFHARMRRAEADPKVLPSIALEVEPERRRHEP